MNIVEKNAQTTALLKKETPKLWAAIKAHVSELVVSHKHHYGHASANFIEIDDECFQINKDEGIVRASRVTVLASCRLVDGRSIRLEREIITKIQVSQSRPLRARLFKIEADVGRGETGAVYLVSDGSEFNAEQFAEATIGKLLVEDHCHLASQAFS